MIPNIVITTSHKKPEIHADYPSWEWKLDSGVFHGNKLDAVFSKQVSEEKYA